MRMLGYIRVSTAEQVIAGGGLAAQEQAVRAGCEQRGWELIDLVVDEGVSAGTLDRPGLAGALERIARREGEGLVAAKLDRLSRSVADFAALLEWFQDAKATLVALDLSIDTSTAAGRLVANVFASVAQWEREVIGERTKVSLQALRMQGRPISAPCVVDDEALAGRILSLRTRGWTYRRIADLLNKEGVPTVRGGLEWRVSSVQAAAGYRRPPRKRRIVALPALS